MSFFRLSVRTLNDQCSECERDNRSGPKPTASSAEYTGEPADLGAYEIPDTEESRLLSHFLQSVFDARKISLTGGSVFAWVPTFYLHLAKDHFLLHIDNGHDQAQFFRFLIEQLFLNSTPELQQYERVDLRKVGGLPVLWEIVELLR